MNNLFNQFQTFIQNPMSFISKLNIPQQYMNNPNDVIQYLMNTGRLSQEQYNQAVSKAKELENNPMFKQFFKR